MRNKILRHSDTVMEPNMALSAMSISLPLTINLSLLPLLSHLKYNVSYCIMHQKLINISYTGK